jgi:hypothetical protein
MTISFRDATVILLSETPPGLFGLHPGGDMY